VFTCSDDPVADLQPKASLKDDKDYQCFVQALAEACGKAAWRIYARCLMPNHFRQVVETPQGNLVAGMKWFLGT
jgi:REP element-mobilizing transposase RayT